MRRLLIAATAGLALALAAGGAEAQGKLKVCFIYVGPHNDGGYSEMHDVARQQVEKELGDKVETTYVENVAEGPDAERALEGLARSGCGLIFSTSFVSLLLPLLAASRWRMRSSNRDSEAAATEFRPAATLNASLYGVLRLERWLIQAGLRFPVGGTRLIAAVRLDE